MVGERWLGMSSSFIPLLSTCSSTFGPRDAAAGEAGAGVRDFAADTPAATAPVASSAARMRRGARNSGANMNGLPFCGGCRRPARRGDLGYYQFRARAGQHRGQDAADEDVVIHQ